jgi:hypothetical protein
LVFFHLIKLAFTIGIESSFQVVEISNQWLHFLSSSSKGVFSSATMIVILDRFQESCERLDSLTNCSSNP